MRHLKKGEAATLRFSVIVPTYQRQQLVLSLVRSLAGQEFDCPFEVIVVVDGSTDGTAEALRDLTTPFLLTVLEQPNRGAAAARNRGAELARGEILLFLDDDMEADSRLLAEHDRSHREGADVVLGHMPLHPDSPVNILSAGVGLLGGRETGQTSQLRDARLTLHDLLTGQLSLSRKTFLRCCGFDASFTLGGAFGNEDVDFGYRLLSDGYRIVFNPNAVSWQKYIVGPRAHLKQWRDAGPGGCRVCTQAPGTGRDDLRAERRQSLDEPPGLGTDRSNVPVLAKPLTRSPQAPGHGDCRAQGLASRRDSFLL